MENVVMIFHKTNKLINFFKEDLMYMKSYLNRELDNLSGKKILITGGAGFLSFYFSLIIIYFNESVSKRKKIKLTLYDIKNKKNLPKWLKDLIIEKKITYIKQSITKPIDQKLNFDYIIHLASIASPIKYRKYPLDTIWSNIKGLENIMNYSLKNKNKVKSVLFMSSSEIYGDPDSSNIPTSEDYNGNVSCTGPRACYDEAKRFGETLCVNYYKQYKLPIKIARPFNNYGPGLNLDDGRVIADFFKFGLKNKDIQIFSSGSPTRTFCYVSDAIISYFKILIFGRDAEPYNVGKNDNEISIFKLSKCVIKVLKKYNNFNGKIKYKINKDINYLTHNPNRRAPNVNKLVKDLNFKPSINLESGLIKTLFWYKSEYSIS